MTFQDPRRARFLQEMGVGPLWRLRDQPEAAAPARMVVEPVEPVEPVEAVAAPRPQMAPPLVPATDDMAWDDAVPSWVSEAAPVGLDELWPEHAQSAVDAGKPAPGDVARMDWEALQAAVAACTRCRLCEGRTHTVFGAGERGARWLFVGEGPGNNEDLQGEPFVGPAGNLLDNMLAAMGLRRGENAYIANVVKCRPTGEDGHDRPPMQDEIAACLPYLERQIALIGPSVIVALGKSAAQALLQVGVDTPLMDLRGRVHRHGDVPLVVTYHPAYLLRKPVEKGGAWRDLCLAMATHDYPASAR